MKYAFIEQHRRHHGPALRNPWCHGWLRIWRELVADGVPVGKTRVQQLMQLHGIRANGKRRFKVTTDSNHKLPISPNLLNLEFTVVEPDKVWVGDITYIETDEGWLFLAVVIDLFSRQVVGWSLRDDMTSNIVIDALRMAWFKRHPCVDFHPKLTPFSNRGQISMKMSALTGSILGGIQQGGVCRLERFRYRVHGDRFNNKKSMYHKHE